MLNTKDTIRLISRTHRTEIINFYMDGYFDQLPSYTGVQLSRENRIRGLPKGWVIPKTCYGKAGIATPLQRETIRQFIYRNFPVQKDSTMVAFEPWHDEPVIVIYRRVF